MRLALRIIGGNQRYKFYGTFIRNGRKTQYKYGMINTVLLADIVDEEGHYLCDHLWFNETKGFKSLELQHGDCVSFYGRVKPYIKGYLGNNNEVYTPIETDYQISYPTKIERAKKPKVIKKKLTKRDWQLRNHNLPTLKEL